MWSKEKVTPVKQLNTDGNDQTEELKEPESSSLLIKAQSEPSHVPIIGVPNLKRPGTG